MKFVMILFILSTAAFVDCKKDSVKDGDNMQDSKVVYSEQKKFGELEFSFTAKILEKGLHNGIEHLNDNLIIDYRIKNNGSKQFVVFNRGHIAQSDGKSEVYVEPSDDDAIEVSQKAFVEPKDKQCPLWLIPRASVGSLLKGKGTTKEKLSLELPPKLNTPYAECKPIPEMPVEIKQAKFCVGVAEVLNRKELKINEKGLVQGRDGLGEQQLLCSNVIQLK